MKTALLPICLMCAVGVSLCLASEPNAIRNKLDHDSTIQGIPCARGDAWFYPNGALNQCTLSRSTKIGDVLAPRHSVVEVWPNGAPHYLTIPRSAMVGGYRVMGSRAGSSSTVVSTFYSDGKLRSVYLVGDQTIEGVPCRGGSEWNLLAEPGNDSNYVEFFDDGTLESCRLAHEYGGHSSGQRFSRPRVAAAAETGKSQPAQ